MKTWRRFREALEAGTNQKVTRIGLLFTLTIVLVALAAFSSANNLLFLILAAMLSTILVSDLVSRLSLAGLALDFLLPEHICAGRTITARILIQNGKRWMASFSIHLEGIGQNSIRTPLYYPVIAGGALIEQPVELRFERRGSYRENSFRFSTRFPFGFAERRINVHVRREVLVYPSVDPQPGFESLLISLTGEMASIFRGQGADFYRIRPYEALETVRHVDWKATAHTGDLQVREFAREQEQPVTFSLDLDVPADRAEWFERAVDCCAYLAWHLSNTGRMLRFRTQDIELTVPNNADVYTILKYLATVVPTRGNALSAPNESGSYQIVFSAAPGRLASAGWPLAENHVRMLGPAELPAHPVLPD